MKTHHTKTKDDASSNAIAHQTDERLAGPGEIPSALQDMADNSPQVQQLKRLQTFANDYTAKGSSSPVPRLPVQRVPRAQPLPVVGEGQPVPQQLYKDDRGGPDMINTGGNVYDIAGGPTVTHIPASDQYKIDDTTFWDPETGARLVCTGGLNYRQQDGAIEYVWSRGHYTVVPAMAANLTAFFDEIWGLRAAVAGENTEKKKLKYLYKRVYCKEAQNTKQRPAHCSPTIAEMVAVSAGKNGHIQGGVDIPRGEEDFDHIQDISLLNTIRLERGMGAAANDAAYYGLCNQYYYYTIHGGASNARLILNVSPTNVPNAIKTIWPILNFYDLVKDMKAAGPIAAATKLDSIVIYFFKGPGHRSFVRAIRDTGVANVDLVPGLTEEKAPGLAVADEPDAVEGVNISFGQKRIILAYMALAAAGSAADMRKLGGAYFTRAGINAASPSEELAVAHLANVEAELSRLLGVWNA